MRKVILEPHKEKSNLWCWNVLQYSESQDINVMRKVILEPHKEKSNLWCWNVLQYSESQDTWYSIGSGIEVNWDIAARKAKETIQT